MGFDREPDARSAISWAMPAIGLAGLLPIFLMVGWIGHLLGWHPDNAISGAPATAGSLVMVRWYESDVTFVRFLGLVGIWLLSFAFQIFLTDAHDGWASRFWIASVGAAVGCYALVLATRVRGRPESTRT